MDKDRIILDMGTLSGSLIKHDLFNPIHLRYTVTFDHDIDEELLKKAWDKTKKVYPVIDSVLEFDHGNADFYRKLAVMKPEERIPYLSDHMYLMRAEDGVNDPVKTKVPVNPGTQIVGGRIINISFYERTVSISAYHVLVDGGGLNMIFSTFLYSYLASYTGHEDENPIVELTEGRKLEDYYVEADSQLIFAQEYTPVPLFTMPFMCKGFRDKDMFNDGINVYSGSVDISAADFMKFCKENGANPSSMLCTLLAKASYALNPEENRNIVFGLTLSARKMLGLENTIANADGCAIAYTSRDDIENKSVADVSQKIRKDLDMQRSKDYYVSYGRLIKTYKVAPDFQAMTVTYVGKVNIGDNNSHIVDFSMETNGDTNLYLMQLNDKFILTLQYGKATEKYLNEFNKIFTEYGIKSEISHPAHYVDKDSNEAVL